MIRDINVEFDPVTVPDYSIHNASNIKGFFGKYSFLSNFCKCPNGIHFNNLVFPSTENAYQSFKFSEKYIAAFTQLTATQSKELAKMIKDKDKSGYCNAMWKEKKYDIMFGLVFQKFTNDLDFKKKLIDTKDKYLEETNSWNDTYWGVCNGIGENNLGKILMRIRAII
ncbi:MAG TPA: NADAR family protein [Candidatus Dojkabacteria bacterium]|nr:NADAR family protein [Candidatus Dojkabacteria bacterium]